MIKKDNLFMIIFEATYDYMIVAEHLIKSGENIDAFMKRCIDNHNATIFDSSKFFKKCLYIDLNDGVYHNYYPETLALFYQLNSIIGNYDQFKACIYVSDHHLLPVTNPEELSSITINVCLDALRIYMKHYLERKSSNTVGEEELKIIKNALNDRFDYEKVISVLTRVKRDKRLDKLALFETDKHSVE